MTPKEQIKAEFQRRMDLVNDKEFRTLCAKIAKESGITPEEWNTNKAAIIMYYANKACKIENNLKKAS